MRYIVQRLIGMLLTALAATVVIFLISSQVPGDPVLAQLGDLAAADPAIVQAFRDRWRLDDPLATRYWAFLTHLVQGDLGMSISTQRPVMDDIRQYAPATIELATAAFALSLLIGVPLGIAAGVWRDSPVDHVARLISLVGVSAPTFWLAFIAMSLFYGGLQIAPGPGRLDVISIPPQSITGL
ncbi:MAG: ABC transporter permease, partial [Gammaproteobacteria bacterium]|nr:ABC transporter permease [Gammaproteobacteria bacterium]MBU1443798.1 ABC transporter permease [Gammaproteobacteria bacterium]